MSSDRMRKKTALVTGAGGGLGRATVDRLVSNGWRVFATDVSEDLARPSRRDPDLIPAVMDVTDAGSIRGAFEAVSTHTDRLDAIVNFAGVMGIGSMVDISEERFARILDINLMGTFRVNKRFFPMVEAAGGRIVNISSEAGWQSPAPFTGPYAISKHAVEAYSTALRREAALVDVRVITIQPGSFETAMASGIEPAFALAAEETERFGPLLNKLKGLAVKAAGTASDPDLLAQVIVGALTAKHPRPSYSVKPDTARSVLEYLPLRAIDKLYLAILRHGSRR